MDLPLPLALFSAGPGEMLVLGVLAVLLFGKRLPEVGRSLGKGLIEFKRGLHGIENEIFSASNSSTKTTSSLDTVDHEEMVAPKFDPPASQPEDETIGA